MNYQHTYHAGNFADVFKHSILVMLMQHLCQKDKPILYLDTHAGLAKYDLSSELAQKTREYENGIAQIYGAHEAPTAIRNYLTIVRRYNTANQNSPFPQYYPGSSSIIHDLLRTQDRMILAELDADNAKKLKQEFVNDTRVAVHAMNGYQAIKAFLPPKTGRGLILIDPPFEEKNEFANILHTMSIAKQRFPIGIYALWYPIKDVAAVKKFNDELRSIGFDNILTSEITIGNRSTKLGLTSCGMTIINPPWNIETELKSCVSWLCDALYQKD